MEQFHQDWFRETLKISDPEELKKARQNIENVLKSNSKGLKILSKVLSYELEKLNKTKITDYSCPSWAYQAADLNGQKRQLEYVLQLINI